MKGVSLTCRLTMARNLAAQALSFMPEAGQTARVVMLVQAKPGQETYSTFSGSVLKSKVSMAPRPTAQIRVMESSQGEAQLRNSAFKLKAIAHFRKRACAQYAEDCMSACLVPVLEVKTHAVVFCFSCSTIGTT